LKVADDRGEGVGANGTSDDVVGCADIRHLDGMGARKKKSKVRMVLTRLN
jgi:hypothetical protein